MILSIDTSTTVCSVALHQTDGTLVAFYELHVEQSHAEYLNQLIANVMGNAGVKNTDLKAVAISEGPGSYTGLRIGTAAAKGFCYTLEIPLIAVSTLKSMAKEIAPYYKEGILLCPMIDARRMEVYTALYDTALNETEKVHPKVMDETSFKEELDKQPIVFFGNGADKCKEVLAHENSTFLDGIVPSAKHVGTLAAEKFAKEEFEDVAYFEPFYLKEFRMTKPKKKSL
ncbi:tRNA (adenosine(37)-N6)-threonylcarbamoyltransferase complex dimerization subunit type 1 TsaB [Limibacter armeniacum]|uniref:tRNA (adenosine(37)-N6)-threonylcarbamoyltransferase complex dimerization subunit type 1 TsaB n=1 Tax=Limibacter armeniacum TaxID=466084 RepID=UPI002FE5716F